MSDATGCPCPETTAGVRHTLDCWMARHATPDSRVWVDRPVTRSDVLTALLRIEATLLRIEEQVKWLRSR